MIGKVPFPDCAGNIRILKIVIILSPALLILFLELLRHLIFGESRPLVGDSLLLTVVVILAVLFYGLVFGLIERAQQENLRRNRELGIVSEIALMVNESLNLNVLLPHAMEKLIRVTRADSGELFLTDRRNRELSYALHVGIPTEASKLDSSALTNDDLVSEVARSNEPVVIEDMKTSESAFSTTLAVAGFRSLAIVPLKSRSGIVGVFALLSFRPGRFKLSEVSLLTNIGNHIAVAIENARLSEKVQAMAIVEERERIAKELHDGLAQVLGYVITRSQAARQILRKMDEATEYLVELEKVAQDVYTDTREDILGLRASIAGDRDMVSALRKYLTRFSQMHDVRTTLEVGDQIIPCLSPQVELQVIRIVQEALSNIRKHAEASHALVKVSTKENEVILVIEDDGKGFDVDELEKVEYSKFGIRTIRERAESIHSRLEIESRTGHGTKVTLSIPTNPPQPSVEQCE
ncbi:MAG: GAF domain-containing sensor histidine kinase [Dehalococcoidia bacterium]|nr:GAF domain-containing sensor histidine kinase [Dehalococcoidia bacterium]